MGKRDDGTSAAPPQRSQLMEETFEHFRDAVKLAVDARLGALLDARVAAAAQHGPDVEVLAAAVRSLAMRGGKRLRAVLLAVAFEGYGGGGGGLGDDAGLAGAAIELLQTYLLIHDDVMDGDELRRGGPSVHASLRDRFGSARAGETGAILAGDFASALAQDALLSVSVGPERVALAARELARMQIDVVCGQLLDMRAGANDRAGVEAMHTLKTASYTVRGPLLIGAILAGASAAQKAALERFATPLGVAFQLRDDLLGTFGDPARTGKPAATDLREGKRTALVVEISGDPEVQALLSRVSGANHEDDDVQALAMHIERSGARARVEARLAALALEAEAALDAVEMNPRGQALLAAAAKALVERES